MQTAAIKILSPTPAKPSPLALGAPHWAAGKGSQQRRSNEGKKMRDGKDGGESPVSHPGTSTW